MEGHPRTMYMKGYHMACPHHNLLFMIDRWKLCSLTVDREQPWEMGANGGE